MNTIATTCCTRCGNDFDEEEQDNPKLDKGWDNEPICDNCYRELYEIDCPLCENLFDDPQKWEDGQYIFAPVGVETPGIYKVLQWPFWAGQLLGDAWYIDGAIEFVKPH